MEQPDGADVSSLHRGYRITGHHLGLQTCWLSCCAAFLHKWDGIRIWSNIFLICQTKKKTPPVRSNDVTTHQKWSAGPQMAPCSCSSLSMQVWFPSVAFPEGLDACQMGQSSLSHPPTLRGQTGSPWWGERHRNHCHKWERQKRLKLGHSNGSEAGLTGSSCTAMGLKGTLQRPNSWESTLISLCLGDTTFTWKETNIN